jgi:gamma-glutamylputrescine oxidase
MSYVETYYRPGAAGDPPRPALAGRHEAEICVVGGGLSGLSAALELARRGRSVCVLESRRIAWGASGRNGGFVSPGWAARYKSIEARVGAAGAKELHRLSMEGVRIVAGNLQALAVPDADPVPGILGAVRYEASDDLKKHRDWLEREFGYRVEFKSQAELAELVTSPAYRQALYDPNAFHFHPLNYARALAREIERLGGRIFEASPAVGLQADRPEKTVRTEGGEVHARHAVLASGGYTGGLVPRLARSFLPIATYVMLTAPAPELIATAIRTRAGIADDRRAGDYYRLVDDGRRILWGGKITTRTSEPRRLAELLRRTMVATYPQLRDLPVDIAWSGLMSYARHLMPQIGRLQDGVWHCTAFGGHGLNTTAIGGRVIAEAITAESDRYKLFAPFGLVWNGGIAGRLAAQLTYWSYQAADLYRERRSA